MPAALLLRESPPRSVGAAAAALAVAARSSARPALLGSWRSAHSDAGAAHGERAAHDGGDTAASEPLMRLLECALPHVKTLVRSCRPPVARWLRLQQHV
jgi:hypothetical protein